LALALLAGVLVWRGHVLWDLLENGWRYIFGRMCREMKMVAACPRKNPHRAKLGHPHDGIYTFCPILS
jgi:hypothetical protein